ncbi:MAG: hypothetical protein RR234_00965, partial [Christensenella sp.]
MLKTDKPKLTKNADKMICILFKKYLERRKNGISKADAICFDDGWQNELFPKENSTDIDETAKELIETFKCRLNIIGDFFLSKDAIIYMENRFPDGLCELL